MTFKSSALFALTIIISTVSFAQVSDQDVEIDDPVTLSQHFKKWPESETAVGKTAMTGVIISADALAANFSAYLAWSSFRASTSPTRIARYEKLSSVIDESYPNTSRPMSLRLYQQMESPKMAQRIGRLSTVATVYFVVDAIAGTVIAMNGNKPLIMINAPALASYLVRNTTNGMIKHQATTQAERSEYGLLMKALYGAEITPGEAVTLDQHFENWAVADSKFERIAKVGAVDAAGIGLGGTLSILGSRHAAFVKGVRDQASRPLSTRDLKALAKGERFATRYGSVGKAVAVYFIFEAVSGTIVAIKGNKPVYVGNFPGLASFAYKRAAAKNNPSNISADEQNRLGTITETINEEILRGIYAEAPGLAPQK